MDAGWATPHVEYSAIGGESLRGHRDRASTITLVDQGDWDVVVLQEYSTKPTDNIGDPLEFKTDVTWFHDRIRASSPNARIVLYETWARHPDHSFYPGSFENTEQMQAQLRFHYNDAANDFIPQHAEALVDPPVEVAPVGDAWESHLFEPDALRLHGSDDYHAGSRGKYLNGLVIYSTIYNRSALDQTARGLQSEEAIRLQQSADATTGKTIPGGPSGLPRPVGLVAGEAVLIDFGSQPSFEPGWNNLDDATSSRQDNLRTIEDQASTLDVAVTVNFGGVNSNGLGENDLGYPTEATTDSFFAGSFDDHADGLLNPGQITVQGLDPAGQYDLLIFSSRTGDDGGRGRLTRYTVDGQFEDLEVADNAAEHVRFDNVYPTPNGELTIDVAVSPAGRSRFAYIGVLELARQ